MFWRRGDKVCSELTLWHVFHHMVTKHAKVTKYAGSASDVTYFVTLTKYAVVTKRALTVSQFDSTSASFLFKSCDLWTLTLTVPSQNETLKWLIMQKSFWW